MTRGQRAAHRLLWLALAPLLVLLVAFAVATRVDAPTDPAAATPRPESAR